MTKGGQRAGILALLVLLPGSLAAQPAVIRSHDAKQRNSKASELRCERPVADARAGGLVNIAPDGTGSTAGERDCIILSGVRDAAQIGRAIEVSDGANGPPSAPGMATAASASYGLSLVNVRPGWPTSRFTGEADGLSVFVRQTRGDTAGFLSNVGVRWGFAATLESHTFSADEAGRPIRAVRTQLGIVNSRDGGEYGLVLQAENGHDLSAGLRIASLGGATWHNYLETVNSAGQTVAYIRGTDGAFVGSDILPAEDLHKTIGSPTARYAATYSQVLQLSPVTFSNLPRCGGGFGGGTLAYISDAKMPSSEAQAMKGGGQNNAFVKCDGFSWRSF